jgi:hypothetical protein
MVSLPSVLNCSIAVAPLAAAVIGPTDRYTDRYVSSRLW